MNNSPINTGTISCKVVLLGESGVGKTSIISRYINNTFASNNMSTTGASFAAKTMFFENHDKNLKFEIWDTAGQEKYRALTKIFYKDASVAILVYDITRKESFDEIKNFWYGQLKENAPKKLIFGIAANKSDLYETEEVDEQMGRAFAKEINAIFRLTSAKNSSGVEDLFRNIGNRYIDPNYEDSKNKTPDEIDMERVRSQTVKISKDQGNTETVKKRKCC